MNTFVIHACEQVLRFTSTNTWDDLSEERKVQLAFNVGVAALGLDLTKQEGYDPLAQTCTSATPIQELHQHWRALVITHNVAIHEENVAKSF